LSKQFGVVCGILLLIALVAGSYLWFFSAQGESMPNLAEVKGVVLLDGEPLPEVRVSFLPDPEAEVIGGPGIGITDSAGRFTLHYRGDKSIPGAVIGKNRVVLIDEMAIRTSRDDDPVPRRFDAKYTLAATTDVFFNVADVETQNFTIDVTEDDGR